jgi:hypothetical protein
MAGKALQGAGRWKQAADCYRLALKGNPQLTDAQRSLDTLEHSSSRQP